MTTEEKLQTPVELANTLSFTFGIGESVVMAAAIYQPLLNKIKDLESRIQGLEKRLDK